MKIFGFIISLFCISNVGWAQGQVYLHPDSVKGKFIPTGIRLGTELINIGRSLSNSDLTEFTFTADVDFNRYYLNIELGSYDRSFSDPVGSVYDVSGTYLRIGPDINFLQKDPDRNMLFFGFRYGRTSLNDELTYTNTTSVFDNEPRSISNNGLNASWGELVTGMKVNIWKTFWLGYTARFRFGVDTFERNELIPHYIPGYGRADKTVSWGLNYWLMFRIPFRDTPKVIFED